MSKFSDFNAYTKQGIIPLFLLGIPQKKAFTQPVLTAAKPCGLQRLRRSWKSRLATNAGWKSDTANSRGYRKLPNY